MVECMRINLSITGHIKIFRAETLLQRIKERVGIVRHWTPSYMPGVAI